MALTETLLEDDPYWYKDAIIYQVHLKSFFDSNNDGIGDFQGLLEKLDYLEGLGITAVWLLPFYPSPLRDDGYDIAEYYNINPDYGTLRDFRKFLRAAHARGIRVITELVVNHTSDKHAWFQRARRARPGSVWRDFYVWSDTPDKYSEARIIFKDFETSNWAWDPVAKAYYWHRFYSHQPDLNYDNPRVQKEIFRVLDFWFGMGVDGMRLDAVPYLYEREGTNCENLPETHVFLKKLREHVDKKFKNRMLLAEANQWPEDAVAYFGQANECHMAFHFPVMPRLFMGVRMEDRFPIVDILEQTPVIDESCQWAMFLRNHDELTLEMVTDEERDYMYRVYAQDPRAKINLGIRRRLAPLLDNNRRKMELMNKLLYSLPGTPVIYYGDEIGMGDNYYLGDRDGVRTPMQWSSDRNAGFSKVNPHKLYLPVIIDPEYHYEALNVENQERNPSSMLWWMKRVIAMRKRFKSFGRGTLEFLYPENGKVLAFLRQYQDELILVVLNLSRFSQIVELDLARFAGYVPVELFGNNKFPLIKEAPYIITLAPHDHYWLMLEKQTESIEVRERNMIPLFAVKSDWQSVLAGALAQKLEKECLPYYIRGCRWFGGKARTIQRVRIVDDIPLLKNTAETHLLIVRVSYVEGGADSYLLPVAFAEANAANDLRVQFPQSVIGRVKVGEEEGILYDATFQQDFRDRLLSLIAARKKAKGQIGEILASQGQQFRRLLKEPMPVPSRVLKAEQSNTSILYKDIFILKLYRRLEEGLNPDLEIEKFLNEKTRFRNIPPFAGALEWRQGRSQAMAIGLLQGYVSNVGDAWTVTLDAIGRYFERVLANKLQTPDPEEYRSVQLDLDFSEIPLIFQNLVGGVYLEMANLLGKRTGEMHLALASSLDDPSFEAEPFSTLYQRAIYQSIRSGARKGLRLLEQNLKKIPEPVQTEAADILEVEPEILKRIKKITAQKISAMKIRIHGDYHLGQVLSTGKDFIIIDFEGEPARPPSERRLKYSALRDVAGMIRSFHYAGYSALLQHGHIREKDIPHLEPWVEPWFRFVSGVFLKSYIETAGTAAFIPKKREELQILLNAYLLDKAIYELAYELNNRPDWVIIPVKGIKLVLEETKEVD